jgi:hypothetical protein
VPTLNNPYLGWSIIALGTAMFVLGLANFIVNWPDGWGSLALLVLMPISVGQGVMMVRRHAKAQREDDSPRP